MYDYLLQRCNSLILKLENTLFHIKESKFIQDIIQYIVRYWWVIILIIIFIVIISVIWICRKNQKQPRKQNNQDDDFLQKQNLRNGIRDKTNQSQNDSQNLIQSRFDQNIESEGLLNYQEIGPQINKQLSQPNKDEYVVQIQQDNPLPPQKQNLFNTKQQDFKQKIKDDDFESQKLLNQSQQSPQNPGLKIKSDQQQNNTSEIEQQMKEIDPIQINQNQITHISILIPQLDQINLDNLSDLQSSAPQNMDYRQQDIFNEENYKLKQIVKNPIQEEQIVKNPIQEEQIVKNSTQLHQLYQINQISPPQKQQIVIKPAQEEQINKNSQQSTQLDQMQEGEITLQSTRQPQQDYNYQSKPTQTQGKAPPQNQQIDQNQFQEEEKVVIPQLDQLPQKQQLVQDIIEENKNEIEEASKTYLDQQKEETELLTNQPKKVQNQQIYLPQEQQIDQDTLQEEKKKQFSITQLDKKQGNAPPKNQQIDQNPIQEEEETEKFKKLPQQIFKVKNTVGEEKLIEQESSQLYQKQGNSPPQYQQIDLNKLKQEEQNDKILQEAQIIQEDKKENQNKIAYQIIDSRFYKPSFKQRKIEDEYLQKFIRDFQNAEQYSQEYNLDGSQELLFKDKIQLFLPVRGDGNCLFTSIGIQYVYYNLIDDQRFERFVKLINQSEFIQIYQEINEQKQLINQFQIVADEEQGILKQEFLNQLIQIKNIKGQQQLLKAISQAINDQNGPFYGLLIIFMRNYFKKLLSDFQKIDEIGFIQNPDQINEITTWEYMYDETDIALKIFAAQEQILIRCYQKMNVDDKIVQISEYKDDELNQFQYKIGLAFQPGHYNAIILSD